MNNDSDFFAPPPFRPDAALQQLKRELRGLGLAEREGRFERRGTALVQAATDGVALQVAVAKEPSSRTAWQSQVLHDAAQVRAFVSEVKQRLARWGDQDD